jgi:hypothetical protein
MKKNIIAIEVTKKLFDKAVKVMNRADSYVASDCLIAQAVRTEFPRKQIHASYDTVDVMGKDSAILQTFILSKNAQRLIHRFDACYFEPSNPQCKRLRASLPVTIKLTEKEEE